jgi:hypothetical protein
MENIAPSDPQTKIFAHDDSDTELPTQNATTDKNPTQNDEISTETRIQQQISDSETTCADYTQETQLLPGTQQISRFPHKTCLKPALRSSHTETPSNLPPTAKFASGLLQQRISEAVSNILTRIEQQISDSETTCAGYTIERHYYPEPNQISRFPHKTCLKPAFYSSHTETPLNSPPTAKFASGPLQRISEAVSNILTPKTAKFAQIPASTNSNPNLRLRPIFPRRLKVYLRKIPHPGIRTLNHRICHKIFC